MKQFTVVLENWDGKCKRATVDAANEVQAWGVAAIKFKNWICAEVIAK